jgi:hypothetical protein
MKLLVMQLSRKVPSTARNVLLDLLAKYGELATFTNPLTIPRQNVFNIMHKLNEYD